MGSVKNSFIWSAVEQIAPRFATIFITIALARLLQPSDFGLMGLLAIFLALSKVFSDFGLSASLIQRKVLNEDDETSVFAMNVGVGLVLAASMAALSPLVASFYEQPVLMPMLCVLALTVVTSSFNLVQLALLSRALQFKQIAVVGSSSTVLSGIVAVVMAYTGFGVWSLVGMHATQSLVQLVMYWRLSSWRPVGRVRWRNIASMWTFSSYLLYCHVIGTIYQNMYAAIIGKVYSPEILGFYDKANRLRMLPAGILTGAVNRVAFPLLSRMQDDKPLLLRRIREIVRVSLIFSAGGLTLLAVVADPLIPLLFTEKWRPTVPLLRILCFAGVFYPIHALYLMALQAQGHSHLNFRLENIKMVLGVVVVSLVYTHGVTALAMSVVGLTVVAYFLNAWYNVRLLGYRWRMQAADILPTLLLCVSAGSAAWWAGVHVGKQPWVVLPVQALLFAALVMAGIYTFRRSLFQDLWTRLGELRGTLRDALRSRLGR
jgi:O-antigen/teichoic acid export membrane protein